MSRIRPFTSLGSSASCFSLALVAWLVIGACSQADAQTTGYASRSPIVGAAGRINPWGAIAEIVKTAVAPYHWNVQICYSCSGGEQEVIDVENKYNAASLPYNPTSYENDGIPASLVSYIQPPPPNGAIDFGISAPNFIWWAYAGTQSKAGFPNVTAYPDLRLVATIVSPIYLIVAATPQSGITDLSQLAGKPVKVLWDNRITSTAASEVLAYYGLSQASIQAAGGSVVSGSNPANRTNFDVIIFTGDLSEAPEFSIWYQASQQANLNYIQLPDALLRKLQKDLDMIPLTVPIGFLKGIWQPISTVGYIGNSVYGRTDMPDDFAYAIAKGLDERKDLLETGYQHFAYDPAQVWKAYGVPLAKGAERYYREQRYIKDNDRD